MGVGMTRRVKSAVCARSLCAMAGSDMARGGSRGRVMEKEARIRGGETVCHPPRSLCDDGC
eukprot:1561107-Rhodomonas_salina.2